MELRFYEEDLKPESCQKSTRYIGYDDLNEQARAAVEIVGRGTFMRRDTYNAIYPPPEPDEPLSDYADDERNLIGTVANQQKICPFAREWNYYVELHFALERDVTKEQGDFVLAGLRKENQKLEAHLLRVPNGEETVRNLRRRMNLPPAEHT